jgi:hypothetical protein
MALQGYPARVHTGGVKILAGTITLGASSVASTTLTTDGIASSVVRNSAGDYTITLADPVGAFVGFNIEVLAASAADLQPQLTALSTSNKTVQFRTLAGAVATDGASGVVIYVVIMVKEMA